MILGLDVSTSIVGWCVLNDNGELVKLDHIVLNKITTGIYDKANEVKVILNNIKKQYNINNIYVEESLMRFRRGMSSAKTLSVLSKFNGIVSYIAASVFEINPVHILAPHGRKVCGVIISRQSKRQLGIKQIILNHVSKELGDKLAIAHTKTGKPKPWMYDRCDAYIMARAGFLEQLEQFNQVSHIK
jgi:Holliday junction resolvasome RuvABC endonuclease subunit